MQRHSPRFHRNKPDRFTIRDCKNFISTSIQLKRMGIFDEVASLAVFLASDQAAYITGETIRIDGGLGM